MIIFKRKIENRKIFNFHFNTYSYFTESGLGKQFQASVICAIDFSHKITPSPIVGIVAMHIGDFLIDIFWVIIIVTILSVLICGICYILDKAKAHEKEHNPYIHLHSNYPTTFYSRKVSSGGSSTSTITVKLPVIQELNPTHLDPQNNNSGDLQIPQPRLLVKESATQIDETDFMSCYSQVRAPAISLTINSGHVESVQIENSAARVVNSEKGTTDIEASNSN